MFAFAAAAAFAAVVLAPAGNQPAPIRKLVYSFDLSISSNFEAADNDMTAAQLDVVPVHRAVTGVGSRQYIQSAGERGTITVEVMQKQSDDGLVLDISEQTKDARSAEPVTCVVYGDETMMCDESKKINPEEMALLYVLGVHFVNPTRMDDNQHWQYARSETGADVVDDLKVTGHTGDLLNVGFHRTYTVSGGTVERTTTDGAIVYNQALTLPVSLTQDELTDRPSGNSKSQRVEEKLTLKLASDSLTKP